MSEPVLPLLTEVEALHASGSAPSVRIVDLSALKVHRQYHIPGAVYLDYAAINAIAKPVMGLLPDSKQLEKVFSAAGIGPDTHVVAYDEEGGGKAARLLWTLEYAGHENFSLLNGGLHAWANAGLPLESGIVETEPASFCVKQDDSPVADCEFIRSHLDSPGFALLDARSPQEFSGEKKYSVHGGHIPGAVNFDWINVIDQQNAMRLKPADQLQSELDRIGLDKSKQIVNYCHTHHRSSLTYFVLKWLGYSDIKGYPGSWSDWGNRDDTPIETT